MYEEMHSACKINRLKLGQAHRYQSDSYEQYRVQPLTGRPKTAYTYCQCYRLFTGKFDQYEGCDQVG